MQIGGGSGTYATQASGNNFIVKVGTGTILLRNAYATADTIYINNKAIALSRKAVKLTDDNNNVEVFRESVSVVGSANQDWINSYADAVTINSGNDSDHIWNYGGSKVSIAAGTGDDES